MAPMEDTAMSTEKKHKYKCDVCGETITLFVNPTVPPTHACPKQAKRVVEFKEVK